MDSLWIIEFKVVNVIVNQIRKQTTRNKSCFHCREEEAREAGLSPNRFSKYGLQLAREVVTG